MKHDTLDLAYEMDEYNKILNNWEVPHSKSVEEAWAELSTKLDTTAPAKGRIVTMNKKPLLAWTAAAAAIIALVVMFWPANEAVSFETLAGNIRRIELPDQSSMILNAGSVASISDDWSNERKVNLRGEAFFEVVKGVPFKVLTDGGIVEVLGTSFDVLSRENIFLVKCSTGKVRVSCGKNKVEITPGNIAELKDGMLVVSSFDPESKDWRAGEFIYEEQQLTLVLEELERQFGVKINAPDLTGKLYTGRFSNKNLEQALQLVCIPMNLSFEIENNNTVNLQFKDMNAE